MFLKERIPGRVEIPGSTKQAQSTVWISANPGFQQPLMSPSQVPSVNSSNLGINSHPCNSSHCETHKQTAAETKEADGRCATRFPQQWKDLTINSITATGEMRRIGANHVLETVACYKQSELVSMILALQPRWSDALSWLHALWVISLFLCLVLHNEVLRRDATHCPAVHDISLYSLTNYIVLPHW